VVVFPLPLGLQPFPVFSSVPVSDYTSIYIEGDLSSLERPTKAGEIQELYNVIQTLGGFRHLEKKAAVYVQDYYLHYLEEKQSGTRPVPSLNVRDLASQGKVSLIKYFLGSDDGYKLLSYYSRQFEPKFTDVLKVDRDGRTLMHEIVELARREFHGNYIDRCETVIPTLIETAVQEVHNDWTLYTNTATDRFIEWEFEKLDKKTTQLKLLYVLMGFEKSDEIIPSDTTSFINDGFSMGAAITAIVAGTIVLGPIMSIAAVIPGLVNDISKWKRRQGHTDMGEDKLELNQILKIYNAWNSVGAAQRKIICYVLDQKYALEPGATFDQLSNVFGREDFNDLLKEDLSKLHENLDRDHAALVELDKGIQQLNEKWGQTIERLDQRVYELGMDLDRLSGKVEKLELKVQRLTESPPSTNIEEIRTIEQLQRYYRVDPSRVLEIREPMLRELKNWVENWFKNSANTKRPVSIITGQPGTGKSWLAYRLASELLGEHYNISVVKGPDISNQLLISNNGNFRGDGEKYSVHKKHVFFLDDIGTGIMEASYRITSEDIYNIMKIFLPTGLDQSFTSPLIISIREENWNYIVNGLGGKWSNLELSEVVEKFELRGLEHEETHKMGVVA
jgi:hypothetical protein